MTERRGLSYSQDLPVLIYFWCGLLWGYAHLRWGVYGTLIFPALVLPPIARHMRFSLPSVVWRKKLRTAFSYLLECFGWIILIFSVIHL